MSVLRAGCHIGSTRAELAAQPERGDFTQALPVLDRAIALTEAAGHRPLAAELAARRARINGGIAQGETPKPPAPAPAAPRGSPI